MGRRIDLHAGLRDGGGEPYRPEVLLWLGPNGAVLGSEIAKPGEALRRAVESLKKTFDEPMYGQPHRPERLRVASAELAAVLRAGQVEVDIVCAPTPELDEMSTALLDHLETDSEPEPSYLSPAISADAVSAFFEAAADLFRMELTGITQAKSTPTAPRAPLRWRADDREPPS